jgi:hypothetical protein
MMAMLNRLLRPFGYVVLRTHRVTTIVEREVPASHLST